MNDQPQLTAAEHNDPRDQVSRQQMWTAYHEAGHAVMAISLGREVSKVTIQPGKSPFGDLRLGVCQLGKGRTKATKDSLEEEALILLAGMVAEAQFTGEYCHHGASQDLRAIHKLLQTRARSDKQIERLERRLLSKTEHLLRDDGHAMAIELIATELVRRITVSGRAARHYFMQAMKQTS